MGNYEIIKFYQNPDKRPKVLRGGLTLAQARKICDNPELSSITASAPKGCEKNEQKIAHWSVKQKHWFVGFRGQNA